MKRLSLPFSLLLITLLLSPDWIHGGSGVRVCQDGEVEIFYQLETRPKTCEGVLIGTLVTLSEDHVWFQTWPIWVRWKGDPDAYWSSPFPELSHDLDDSEACRWTFPGMLAEDSPVEKLSLVHLVEADGGYAGWLLAELTPDLEAECHKDRIAREEAERAADEERRGRERDQQDSGSSNVDPLGSFCTRYTADRDTTYGYSGQCHSRSWPFYTTDTNERGSPSLSLGPGEHGICGHNGVASVNGVYCIDGPYQWRYVTIDLFINAPCRYAPELAISFTNHNEANNTVDAVVSGFRPGDEVEIESSGGGGVRCCGNTRTVTRHFGQAVRARYREAGCSSWSSWTAWELIPTGP